MQRGTKIGVKNKDQGGHNRPEGKDFQVHKESSAGTRKRESATLIGEVSNQRSAQ